MSERTRRLVGWFSFGAAILAVVVVVEIVLGLITGASGSALFGYDGLITVTVYAAIAAFAAVALFDYFDERGAARHADETEPAPGEPQTMADELPIIAETPAPAEPAAEREAPVGQQH